MTYSTSSFTSVDDVGLRKTVVRSESKSYSSLSPTVYPFGAQSFDGKSPKVMLRSGVAFAVLKYRRVSSITLPVGVCEPEMLIPNQSMDVIVA